LIHGVCADERGGFGEEGAEILGLSAGGEEGEGSGEEGGETHFGRWFLGGDGWEDSGNKVLWMKVGGGSWFGCCFGKERTRTLGGK
jgi:hypothetical protein